MHTVNDQNAIKMGNNIASNKSVEKVAILSIRLA